MEKIRCLFIRRDKLIVLGGLGPGSVHFVGLITIF